MAEDPNNQQNAERRKIMRIIAACVVGMTVVTTALWWDALTSGGSHGGSDLTVGPVVAALRILIVFAVWAGIGFVIGAMWIGKLPRRITRDGVEFDEGPTDEAYAAQSLAKRVKKLEESQGDVIDALEEREKSEGET